MREALRNKIFNLAPTLWQYRALFSSKASYLKVTGWQESLRRGYPCKPDGTELPWMNYPIIKFLEDRLNKDMTLFEFGSGFSTIFYSKLVKNVVSVEYDRTWHDLLKEKAPPNVEIIYIEADQDGRYCRAIDEREPTDVVIIDGRDRVNCIRTSLNNLTERGVIILDDSDRKRYAPIFDIVSDSGFSILDFEGMKPTGFEVHRSSLFYRPGNCLGL